MARQFKIFYQITVPAAACFAAGFWLSILMSFTHITDAKASVHSLHPAGGAAAQMHYQAAKRLTPVSDCVDHAYGCSEYEVSAYTGKSDSEWKAPQEHYQPHGPVVVEVCADGYVPTHEYAGHPPPAPYYYNPDHVSSCGVRCWYKRLTSGFCGRGCEYYRFRTSKRWWACYRTY